MVNNDSNTVTLHQELEQLGAEEPPLVCSEKTIQFKNKFYQNVSLEEWNDWKWQIKNSITSYQDLFKIFGIFNFKEEHLNLPLRITPYYVSTISSIDSGIGKCVIPSINEFNYSDNEDFDSLHEENQSPVKNIVHRYPDRVLFLTTSFCSSYCRYCTRSRLVGHSNINRKDWQEGINYIKNNKSIRDILLSGGDFFCLDNESIDYLLSEIRLIEHVEFIRIGTKVPAVLPQRISLELTNILKKYHPLFLSIHFTHPDELTEETKQACERLADCGIPLGSQTVLLKDVNDDVDTMKKLMHGLLKIRVKPYYIYQCDQIKGTSHFRTKIEKGLEIINSLRGFTSGYAVPRFIVDSHLGKIEISPNNVISNENGIYELRSYKGEILKYLE